MSFAKINAFVSNYHVAMGTTLIGTGALILGAAETYSKGKLNPLILLVSLVAGGIVASLPGPLSDRALCAEVTFRASVSTLIVALLRIKHGSLSSTCGLFLGYLSVQAYHLYQRRPANW